jgi:hypothetical protein
MNLLREEFCKETNTPMGLDDVYNYVKWLENKLQQERSYSEEEVEVIAKDAYAMGRNNILIGVFNKWFEQFKKK